MGSTTKEPAPTTTDAATTQESTTQDSTTSSAAVEELKKEFSQYNQHNLPRDKTESEARPRRAFRGAKNKKEYQRSRGRNKR